MSPQRLRGATWAMAAAMLLVALPLGAPPAEAPAPTPRAVCLGSVDESVRTAQIPGEWREARSWHMERTRDVDLDEDVAVRVIALAPRLEGGVRIADVIDIRERRTETCVLDRLSTLDGQGVLNALALGVTGLAPADGALASLVTQRHVVARFEYSLDQDVDLKREVALGVLALGPHAGPVRLADVLDIERKERIELTYESQVTLDDEQALLALTLRGGTLTEAAPEQGPARSMQGATAETSRAQASGREAPALTGDAEVRERREAPRKASPAPAPAASAAPTVARAPPAATSTPARQAPVRDEAPADNEPRAATLVPAPASEPAPEAASPVQEPRADDPASETPTPTPDEPMVDEPAPKEEPEDVPILELPLPPLPLA